MAHGSTHRFPLGKLSAPQQVEMEFMLSQVGVIDSDSIEITRDQHGEVTLTASASTTPVKLPKGTSYEVHTHSMMSRAVCGALEKVLKIRVAR